MKNRNILYKKDQSIRASNMIINAYTKHLLSYRLLDKHKHNQSFCMFEGLDSSYNLKITFGPPSWFR